MTDNTLVERVAFLLWQANRGILLPEDRALGTNWFLEPVEQQHEDDRRERPGWMAMAEEVIAAVRAEMASDHPPRSPDGDKT